MKIRTAALLASVIALAPAAVVTTQAAASPVSPAACSQNIRVTHSSTSATMTIIKRYCNRSYRAWAGFNIHGTVYGPWRDTNGAFSIAYYSGGGNQGGGYQYEQTGGGTITTHTSY